MKKILIISLLLLCGITYSQTTLKTGDSLVRKINFGESQKYKVKISNGSYYKLEVFQKGISGHTAWVHNSPNHGVLQTIPHQ